MQCAYSRLIVTEMKSNIKFSSLAGAYFVFIASISQSIFGNYAGINTRMLLYPEAHIPFGHREKAAVLDIFCIQWISMKISFEFMWSR